MGSVSKHILKICLLFEMIGKNRYYRRSKISEAKFRQIVRQFALHLAVTDTAELCVVSVRSTNEIFQKIRHRMFEFQSPFCGEIEADESYFGAKRITGKIGRAAGGKTIVFGHRKRCVSV